jgi:hypothetical protein
LGPSSSRPTRGTSTRASATATRAFRPSLTVPEDERSPGHVRDLRREPGGGDLAPSRRDCPLDAVGDEQCAAQELESAVAHGRVRGVEHRDPERSSRSRSSAT